MTESTPKEIVAYWTGIGPKGWYEVDPARDDDIRARFLPLWERAAETLPPVFRADATGTLAGAILLDQFPRNMFRGDPRSFATDPAALDLVRFALDRGDAAAHPEPLRQFYLMPFCHSEDLAVQEEGIERILAILGEGDTALHARAHADVIRRFGRFPFRNAALGRTTTAEEQTFLDDGGYGAVVRAMQAAQGGAAE